jgi:putative endonuclease
MPDTQKDVHKKLLGKKGECLAEEYLTKQGYRLLKRNYKTPYGEADLVFSHGDEIVFVEVKTRTSEDFATAKQAVNREKQARYRKIALHFGKGCEPNARFDVIEIYSNADGYRINHLIAAF